MPLTARLPCTLRTLEVGNAGQRQPPLGLGACSQLTALNLAANQPLSSGLERLAALGPSLRRLCLASCFLAETPSVLSAMRQLTHLDLSNNRGLQFDPALLAGLSKLEELLLGKLGPWALPLAMSALQPVTLLDLRFASYTPPGDDSESAAERRGLSNLGALEVLLACAPWTSPAAPCASCSQGAGCAC